MEKCSTSSTTGKSCAIEAKILIIIKPNKYKCTQDKTIVLWECNKFISKLNNKAILTKNISNALIKKDDTSLNGGANCCEIFIT